VQRFFFDIVLVYVVCHSMVTYVWFFFCLVC
jgi:hypothetical protein